MKILKNLFLSIAVIMGTALTVSFLSVATDTKHFGLLGLLIFSAAIGYAKSLWEKKGKNDLDKSN